MNAEFFEALAMLGKEKGLPAEYLLEKIQNAIVIAVKKDYDVEDENVAIVIDPEDGKFNVSLLKTIVDEVQNPHTEISLEEAMEKRKTAKVGGQYAIPLKTKDFGRIAAQTAKHVIRQGLKEAERSQQYAEMQSKAHEILSVVVNAIDERKGIATLEMDSGGLVTLPRSEQVAGETLRDGQRIKVYVVDVLSGDRGPKMMLSRTHPGLVKRMFEMEVPEIFDGTVEIKAISREAGARTKMAVWSKDENVDPVGACIGPKGQRVARIVEELNGEKIDIVRYSEDPAAFISAALSPATVVGVQILEGDTRACRVMVPDHQLSLAIGNKGQNARLTARLTGYNIDIRPESGYYGEEKPAAEKLAEQTPDAQKPAEQAEEN